jgi:hypothetical protein
VETMSENKKDPLIPLTEEQQKELEDSAKFATLSGQKMDQIVDKLMSLESERFDPHLFLLYQSIFRDAQANPQLLDYVATLDPKELPRFKDTTLLFHYFHAQFINRSIGVDRLPDLINEYDFKLKEIADLFIEYNAVVDDSPYKMPALAHSKKDFWGKLHTILNKGRALRFKK